MSVFLASSSPSVAEIVVIVFAAAGGIIVFVGLLLERIAERKTEKFQPPFFKPFKCLANWGWYILMAGIAVEIGVAVWSANDAWQTRQMAIKNAPINLPIKSMNLEVNLWVLEQNKPDPNDKQLVLFGGYCKLQVKQSVIPLAVLGCREFDNTARVGETDKATLVYSMSFDWPANGMSSDLPAKIAQGDFSTKDFDKEIAGAIFRIPSANGGNVRIVRGSCVLTINGSLQRKFMIPNSLSDIFLIDTNHP